MKARPILMSAPMVRAILEGRKTQTRRILKPSHITGLHGESLDRSIERSISLASAFCPYGQEFDRLWVRETWQGPIIDEELEEEFHQSPDYFKKPAFCVYRATDTLDAINADGEELGWRPSIYMPRWASRILLEVVSVRVERLNDISHDDAMAEGMAFDDAVYDYSRLWEQINGAGSWEANPFVWVVSFKRIEQ